jgi:hypothetical protein
VIDGCIDVIPFGDIGLERSRLAPSGFHLVGYALHLSFVDVYDCNVRAIAREPECDCAANSLTGACDESDLLTEAHVRLPIYSLKRSRHSARRSH